jgi:hypothetical protein
MAIELLRIIPSLLWWCLAVVVLALFYRPFRDELLPHVAGLEAMGVKISFVGEAIDAAIQFGEASPAWEISVPREDRQRALRRARKHFRVLRDAQLLWVDDHPENNVHECNMFRQLGVTVAIARSTEEGLAMLQRRHFDLVVSDMARDEDNAAGIVLLERLRASDAATPVVFYPGVYDPARPCPAGAFGITNRTDELLHLTLDALERKRS